jgi:hypothetical protein
LRGVIVCGAGIVEVLALCDPTLSQKARKDGPPGGWSPLGLQVSPLRFASVEMTDLGWEIGGHTLGLKPDVC